MRRVMLKPLRHDVANIYFGRIRRRSIAAATYNRPGRRRTALPWCWLTYQAWRHRRDDAPVGDADTESS